MNNVQVLDNILLSQNVVQEFKNAFANAEFRNWILSIIPELADVEKQKQDNPWHIYDCLDHILHSVEEMNKQTKDLPKADRRLLAYSMLYHDIGKPACYIRRYGKAYGREIDSFFNHNKVSAMVAKRSAASFGFNDNDAKIIEKLVLDHDVFMYITEDKTSNPYHKQLSKELIKEHIKDLSSVGDGEKLMRYLIMVGRADNKAQNPEMTAKPLHMLATMEKMLKELTSGSFESGNQKG